MYIFLKVKRKNYVILRHGEYQTLFMYSFFIVFLLSSMYLLVQSTVVLSTEQHVMNVRHSWQFVDKYSNVGMPSYQSASSLHFQTEHTKLTLLGSDCSKCLWCAFDMEMLMPRELQLGIWLSTIWVKVCSVFTCFCFQSSS